MILKVLCIAIISIFLSSMLKQVKPEFSTIINVCGGVLIFVLCIDELTKIINYFSEIYALTNVGFDFFPIVVKIIGVGYVTEFASDIAEDFGNQVISSKVLLGGKLAICSLTLPIIKKLLSMWLSFLSW